MTPDTVDGNYVALGLSNDFDMGQDSVVVCGVVDGEAMVEPYWNTDIGGRNRYC